MITKQVSLNIWNTNNVVVYANSGEVDCRYIEVSFKDENQNNINLTNKSVTFYAKKSDNTTIFNYCTVDTINNTATIELTSQALSVPGILECEFQIFDKDNVLLKVNGLKIFVSDSEDFSQAIESSSESNVLTSLINDVKENSEKIGNLVDLTTTEKSNVVGAINEVNSKTIPISQGGTGATTASSAISNLGVSGTVLYSNESGTTGTITLSQPYTNFVRIGVYAQGQYDNDSIYNEMLTSISYMTLGCTSFNDSNYDMLVWRLAYITFSGNTISFYKNGAASFSAGSGNYLESGTNDGLKITHVVGYNY